MRARVLAGLLFVLAGILYFGVAVPAREQTRVAQAEFVRLRNESQRLRVRRTELERRQAVLRRAARVVAGDVTGSADAVNGLRRFLIESLKGYAVRDVQLSVAPGRPPVAASLRLVAAGSFPDVLRLCSQLVRPGSGIILERVRLAGSGSSVSLELDGIRLTR